MVKIMFVCLGNICRSPLAHAVFERMAVEKGYESRFLIESSGTSAYHVGELPDSRMRKTAAAFGTKMTHKSRQFRVEDLIEYDLILPMDLSNRHDILHMAGTDDERSKIRLFRDWDPEGNGNDEVPDPYYGGPKGFELVYQIVSRTCRALIEDLA